MNLHASLYCLGPRSRKRTFYRNLRQFVKSGADISVCPPRSGLLPPMRTSTIAKPRLVLT